MDSPKDHELIEATHKAMIDLVRPDRCQVHAGRAHVLVAKDGEMIRLDPAEALDLAAKLTRWGSNPTNTNAEEPGPMITEEGALHFGDRAGPNGESEGTGDRFRLRYRISDGQLIVDISDQSTISDALCRAYADDGLEQQLEQARELYEGGPRTGVAIITSAEAKLSPREGHAVLELRGELGHLDPEDLRALGRAAFGAARMIDEAEAAKAAARLEIVG